MKNYTLMKKTKAELVDIILRKDDVETKLHAEIEKYIKIQSQKDDEIKSLLINWHSAEDHYKLLQAEIDKLKANVNDLVHENTILNRTINEYKLTVDSHKSIINNLNDEIANYIKENIELDSAKEKLKNLVIVLIVLLIGSLSINILF